MKFSQVSSRLNKYPQIRYDYESIDYSNLYFTGTIAHSLDFRKASGGFIHGFRYTSIYSKIKNPTTTTLKKLKHFSSSSFA